MDTIKVGPNGNAGIGVAPTWWEAALPSVEAYQALIDNALKEYLLPSEYVGTALAYAQEHGWFDVAEIIRRYNDVCAVRRGELPKEALCQP